MRFAQQQYDRAKQLLDAGATSQQEFEQAETNLSTAKAALDALKAREREAGVQLQYFRVTSPTGGVVGDMPVRVGDRVTTSTVLTTVDQQAGLEAYVQIPIERAPGDPARAARAADGRAGRGAGGNGHQLRLAAGGRPHAVGAGEGAGGRPIRAFAPSSSCGRWSSGATSPA